MELNNAMDKSPTPDNFDAYLPWACKALMISRSVIIKRVVQNEYVTSNKAKTKSDKGRLKQSRPEADSDMDKEMSSSIQTILLFGTSNKVIYIKTTYDQNDNLVQIKFDKNETLPYGIFKLLTLIMQFQSHCTNITINKGINNTCLGELVNVISTSNVTDLCLDGTMVKNGHYHILLERRNNLRYLSLSRCNITDEQVEKIAETLIYPEPSSHSLAVLNLASNKITDKGAKYIAIALRSNRHLSYLNISDNAISDDGAIQIFTCLGEFPLTNDEIIKYQARTTVYLRRKKDLEYQFIMDLKYEASMKSTKRKGRQAPATAVPVEISEKCKKSEKDLSKPNLASEYRSNSHETLSEKTSTMAAAIPGKFNDPFSPKQTFRRDYQLYCKGNTKLCYLNIAYNNFTALSLKKLLEVVAYQKTGEKPTNGLININIDGNNLPKTCIEMVQISEILQSSLVASLMQVASKKKQMTK